MTKHLICIGIIIVAYWVAKKVICKADYSRECDRAVKDAQDIINHKFLQHDNEKER